jgi:23S rRNA (cytosine1962-C5)-methyltransferase
MPGLVVDRYAETGVVKLYSAAWVPHLRSCVEALLDQSPLEHLVLRLSRRVARQPEALCGLEDGDLLAGDAPGERVIFRENGLRFEVDPVRGQKTGFFLDQRDNRARVESLTPKGRVLNAFAYTGGFSVYAARGGAHEVWSLDQSRLALEAARRNFELNRNLASVAASTHETLEGDAFESMAELARSGAQFELVVVDPPAFATRRAQVRGALEAYGRLAHLGVTLTAPDGVIVLASCSRPVSAEQFRGAVCSASARAGRPLRILEETTHALDHPTDFAESRYLKCVYARPHARGRR